MRKILNTVVAAAIAAVLSIGASASADSSVSVKNNDPNTEPVTYNYNAENTGEIVTSIKSLMTKLNNLSKQDSVVQTLTVTSESTDNKPVTFKLRISLPDKSASAVMPEPALTYSQDEYSALNYYNITITDAEGNNIYSYEDETEEINDSAYKDISLGMLNQEKGAESKIFNITLSVNKDLDKDSIAEHAKKLDWSIVSDASVQVRGEDLRESGISSETSAPINTSNKDDEEINLSAGEYLCGKDIEPGRYTMTGSGKVHVYAEDGALKTTIALKKEDDSSANGVSEYLINLQDGERVVLESDVQFTPYNASKVTPKPKSTASPQSTAKVGANVKATSAPKENTKNNPKTGDVISISGIISLAVLAVGAFVFIEIKKRKEN